MMRDSGYIKGGVGVFFFISLSLSLRCASLSLICFLIVSRPDTALFSLFSHPSLPKLLYFFLLVPNCFTLYSSRTAFCKTLVLTCFALFSRFRSAFLSSSSSYTLGDFLPVGSP